MQFIKTSPLTVTLSFLKTPLKFITISRRVLTITHAHVSKLSEIKSPYINSLLSKNSIKIYHTLIESSDNNTPSVKAIRKKHPLTLTLFCLKSPLKFITMSWRFLIKTSTYRSSREYKARYMEWQNCYTILVYNGTNITWTSLGHEKCRD